jgi:hypothetical protein
MYHGNLAANIPADIIEIPTYGVEKLPKTSESLTYY